MAIKVGGTTVIDDSRQLSNIASVDATTVAALGTAGVGGAGSINGLSDAYSDGSSIGFGSGALSNDDGTTNNNIAIGVDALGSVTSGNQIVAMGRDAGKSITNGGASVYIGHHSGRLLTAGSANTCIGPNTGSSLPSGQEGNTLIGSNAGWFSVQDNSTAIGKNAMILATTAYGTTAIGADCLNDLTTGNYNTAIGLETAESLTTGGSNTIVGAGAAVSATTINNCLILGKGANPSSNSSSSDEITLGNTSITSLRCNTQTISSLSDKRDKKNVKDLDAGLDFLKALRPVSFDWDQRDKGRVDLPDVGFIAQELLEAQKQSGVHVPNLVSTLNPDKLEAAYSTLIPVLVQAIKDLSQQVDDLKNKS